MSHHPLKVIRVLKAFKEQPEPRLRQERQAPQVHQGKQVLQVIPEQPVILDPRATREHLARLVLKVLLGQQVPKAPLQQRHQPRAADNLSTNNRVLAIY